MRRRSKLLENDRKKQNRSKETKAFEKEERAARKRLENFRTRSNPLERDSSVREQGAIRSKETRAFEEQGANRSKETTEIMNKEQTKRKNN